MKNILSILVAIVGLSGCGSGQNSAVQSVATPHAKDVVEVLYFHGKQRCKTCNAIETLTKEVVENHFADQLKKGEIIFQIIDISTPQGEKMADQYEVTWSSLILDRGGETVNLTKMGFSYAKGQPALFKAKLTESITQILQ
ncbi:MAG: nitrophenyl compound nitroreductase subunit ArsF family protein [Alistipes sp.]